MNSTHDRDTGSGDAAPDSAGREGAVEMLSQLAQYVPADEHARLEAAAADFRAAVRERREQAAAAGMTDPDELRAHIDVMQNAAYDAMQEAASPADIVAGLERAATAVREAPLRPEGAAPKQRTDG